MFNKKSIVFLVLALVLSLSLTFSASAEDYHVGMEHLENLGEQKDIDEVDIAFLTFSLHVSDYSFHVFDGLVERLDELGLEYNIEMNAAGGHGDHETLNQLARESIIGGADILVVHPTVLDMNLEIFEMAYDEQVPLIWFNVGPRGTLDPREEYPAMSYVGYEHYDGGEMVGHFLADYMDEDSTLGLLRFIPGDYVDDRLIAAKDVLHEEEGLRPDIQIVEEYAEGDRGLGSELASDFLSGYPDLQVLYAGNSASAMGAVSSVEDRGSDVGVIGYGATEEEVEAILEGRLLGTVYRDPWDNGEIVADLINKWYEGREDEIEKAYGTFQKFLYSPDLVYEYAPRELWGDWVEEHGEPEYDYVEERDDFEGKEDGFHDPQHLENNEWLEQFK